MWPIRSILIEDLEFAVLNNAWGALVGGPLRRENRGTMSPLEKSHVAHLLTQFKQGQPVLFTGAGFTSDCLSQARTPIPLGSQLARAIWTLCYPDDAYDNKSSLQDLYETALLTRRQELVELVTRQLTVGTDVDSIPQYIIDIYSLPWARTYTLNVDNLAEAINIRTKLPRKLCPVSPRTTDSQGRGSDDGKILQVIHLNGVLADLPDNVTFSHSQYAQRLARREDILYQQLAADLLCRPVIFIGSELDEGPLWQNIEIRSDKGGRGTREMRPRSYLVTPELGRAKAERMAHFNCVWIQMTAGEFAHEVLPELAPATAQGLEALHALSDQRSDVRREGPLVSTLATRPNDQSDYLLGQEPIWADIQSGRSVERDYDESLWNTCTAADGPLQNHGVLLLSGTAGSGKSSSLMRLALRLSASGRPVVWVSKDLSIHPRDLVSQFHSGLASQVLAIDDADLFGSELAPMLREIMKTRNGTLAAIAMRSHAVERIVNPAILADVPLCEMVVPHLADTDIDGILDVLTRENRLGVLRGQPRADQKRAFRDVAGRQLLVAMLSATSGSRFEDKAIDELFGLEAEARAIYALVALASVFRYPISRQEILVGIGETSNQTLNVIDLLMRRNILIKSRQGGNKIGARHRVIAEVLCDELGRRGQLRDPIYGLAMVAATGTGVQSAEPCRRLLRAVINHDYLMRQIGLDQARALYQSMESLLNREAHFWLQRGSLEVENGNLSFAENFLAQARALREFDTHIENEWAYLLMRKAIVAPGAVSANDYIQEALQILDGLMSHARSREHPYHVLGSQGLAWARRGIADMELKGRFLRNLVEKLDRGIEKFPQSSELRNLRRDVWTDLLATVEGR